MEWAHTKWETPRTACARGPSVAAVITDVDEWLHPVDGDPEHWADVMAFRAWDETTGALIYTTTAVTPIGASSRWITWLDGTAYEARAALDEVPPHNWDVMEVGAVGYRMEQARQRWTIQLADGDRSRAFLAFEGTEPCVELSPTHYGQTGRLTGDLHIGDRRIRFDGPAHRDHAWGPGAGL